MATTSQKSAQIPVQVPDDERRLLVMRYVADNGGRAEPIWAPTTRHGYVYVQNVSDAAEQTFAQDLNYLGQHDYLSREFFERVTQCPSCSSHHLDIREICPACGSSHLVSEPLLHHFRCGYVGPVQSFAEAGGGARICPKCGGTLRHLGTEYDIPGEHFTCRTCFANFQDAPAEALCFACGTRTSTEQLAHEDIYAYELTALGNSALRNGRLFGTESEQLIEGDLPLYRRHVFLSLLAEDLRRFKRYKIMFSVLILRLIHEDEEDKENRERLVIKELRTLLREVDLIGRYNSETLISTLPSTDQTGADIVLGRIVDGKPGSVPGIRIRGVALAADKFDDLSVDLPKISAELQGS